MLVLFEIIWRNPSDSNYQDYQKVCIIFVRVLASYTKVVPYRIDLAVSNIVYSVVVLCTANIADMSKSRNYLLLSALFISVAFIVRSV